MGPCEDPSKNRSSKEPGGPAQRMLWNYWSLGRVELPALLANRVRIKRE